MNRDPRDYLGFVKEKALDALEREEPMVLRRNLAMKSNAPPAGTTILESIPAGDADLAFEPELWSSDGVALRNGLVPTCRSGNGSNSAEAEPAEPAEPDRGTAWGEFS